LNAIDERGEEPLVTLVLNVLATGTVDVDDTGCIEVSPVLFSILARDAEIIDAVLVINKDANIRLGPNKGLELILDRMDTVPAVFDNVIDAVLFCCGNDDD
jgi:hypothetical protein